MKIEKDRVVQFTYKMTDTDNNTLEDTSNAMPMAYLHGHGGLLKGLEEAMAGHTENDEFEVSLEPENAYGLIQDNVQKNIPIKHLQGEGIKKWKKGMIAVVQTEQGHRRVTVVKPGKFMALVDFNHPFAGKTLLFSIKIASVREATTEEIAHGHAHGEGGHHH